MWHVPEPAVTVWKMQEIYVCPSCDLKVTVLKSWIIIILEKGMDRSSHDTKVINRAFISYVTD